MKGLLGSKALYVGDRPVRRILKNGQLLWSGYDQSHFYASALRQTAEGEGVVGLGDPVGWVDDLTGHGCIAHQPVEEYRPTVVDHAGRRMLHFDGVNDHLRIEHNDHLDLSGPHSLTVEAWYAMRGSTPMQHWAVVNRYDQFILGLNSVPAMTLLIEEKAATGGWWPLGYGVDPYGQEQHDLTGLHHYAGVFDHANQEIRFYIDGQLVFTREALRSEITYDDGPIMIGAREAGGGDPSNLESAYDNAVIGDVRIWHRVRTAEEIQADMHKRLTGRESGLVVYLPM